MLAISQAACGAVPSLTGHSSVVRPAMIAQIAPVPSGPDAPVAPLDPQAPTPAAAELFPLTFGVTWRYVNVAAKTAGETRTETITQLIERPNRSGPGIVTIAEIQRTETGRKTIKFTVERYPSGLFRSYDPTLPKLGTPLLGTPTDKPQEWGYNPGQGNTGYFQIMQSPVAADATVGGQTYAGCIKVRMATSGQGFAAFQREVTWAPGVGPVRIVENATSRQARVFELVKPSLF
ncbi:MAG: hypothetical protein H7338_13225 [Candidatus Sericytochromatia bacterium]|nr:hypothetical protein [Candidatus Sericytochromatia bacterium]